MSNVHLTNRWGESLASPTTEQMKQALDDLNEPDEDAPDCWLSDDAGWTVSVFENGNVVLQNVDTTEGPWHSLATSRQTSLALWMLLQAGDIDTLKKKISRPGMGDE